MIDFIAIAHDSAETPKRPAKNYFATASALNRANGGPYAPVHKRVDNMPTRKEVDAISERLRKTQIAVAAISERLRKTQIAVAALCAIAAATACAALL